MKNRTTLILPLLAAFGCQQTPEPVAETATGAVTITDVCKNPVSFSRQECWERIEKLPKVISARTCWKPPLGNNAVSGIDIRVILPGSAEVFSYETYMNRANPHNYSLVFAKGGTRLGSVKPVVIDGILQGQATVATEPESFFAAAILRDPDVVDALAEQAQGCAESQGVALPSQPDVFVISWAEFKCHIVAGLAAATTSVLQGAVTAGGVILGGPTPSGVVMGAALGGAMAGAVGYIVDPRLQSWAHAQCLQMWCDQIYTRCIDTACPTFVERMFCGANARCTEEFQKCECVNGLLSRGSQTCRDLCGVHPTCGATPQ